MAQRHYSLNHSRDTSYIAKDIFDRQLDRQRRKATYKQRKYLFTIACTMQENNIDYGMNRNQVWYKDWDRQQAYDTIDKWINLLNQHGIDRFQHNDECGWQIDNQNALMIKSRVEKVRHRNDGHPNLKLPGHV